MDWNYDMAAALEHKSIQLGTVIFGCDYGGDIAAIYRDGDGWVNNHTGEPFYPVGWIDPPPVNIASR